MRGRQRHLYAALGLAFLMTWGLASGAKAQGIVVDHTCTNITQIPQAAVEQAKANLHIAYGHTSHGSQLTDGMTGLVGFMNGQGYPADLYEWSEGGAGGALDLDDYAMDGDVGYHPQWVNNTRSYLGTPNAQGRGADHPNVNVIIWSWCGQASGLTAQQMIDNYLAPMSQLETEYFGITFVYMTGHADGTGLTGNLHQRNQQIRNYCVTNHKVLYDFYDIECYDPDGSYYGDKSVTDGCDYDSDGNGSRDANWAVDWQNTHTQGVDWYSCSAAHTQPLNGNRKAYAAWWLWAGIAGWSGPVTDPTPPTVPQNLSATAQSGAQIDLAWDAATDPDSGVSHYRIYRDGGYIGQTPSLTYSDEQLTPGTPYDYQVSAVNGGGMESALSEVASATTPGDSEPPTAPTALGAQAVSSSRISLTWTAATDNVGVTGYHVYRNGLQVDTTTGLSYSDQGLTPRTTYQYFVTAIDAADNESGHSNTASARTLDPSQEVHTIRLEDDDTGEAVDAFLSLNAPDTNYGSTQYVGTIDHFIIQFNLPTEVMNKHIIEAKLGFFVWNQTDYQAGQYLNIYRVTREWREDQTTWNRAASSTAWTTPGGDHAERVARIPHQEGSASWDHTFYPPADITALVQKWARGQVPNHGLLVINDSVTGIGFKASEYGEGQRPYLEIKYTDMSLGRGLQPAGLILLLDD